MRFLSLSLLRRACLQGVFLAALLVLPFHLVAQEIRAFYIGHSLTSDVPGMVSALVNSQPGAKFSFRHQDIPGAPLRWQWEEKDRKSDFEPTYGGRYHIHLPKGDFTVVVLTDSVPRGGAELEAETVDYLGRFTDFARKQNPDVRVFYYETWHHLTSGTPQNSEYDTASPRRNLKWRERLDADKAMWEEIVAKVNEAHPGKYPVKIIPSGQVLGAVSDAIEAGKIPGWTKITDIFGDEIHTNHYGKYIVALSHYAALTGKSPVGLPIDLKDIWGGNYWGQKTWDGKIYPRPSDETVRAVQEIVADVIPPAQ